MSPFFVGRKGVLTGGRLLEEQLKAQKENRSFAVVAVVKREGFTASSAGCMSDKERGKRYPYSICAVERRVQQA